MARMPVSPLLMAGLAGGAAALAFLSGDKIRSRAEWLERFSFWAGPASDTEDEKVSRTERMVSEALERSQYLSGYTLSCIPHGSSKNNTNVRRNSDLDLVAMCHDPWSLPWPGEALPFAPGGRSFANAYAELRKRVLWALREEFGLLAVGQGSKCLKLSETATTRVACDVLPCFRLRQYLPRAMWQRWNNGQPYWRDGVIFLTASDQQVVSYPEQHLANGRQKNVATGYRYKQVVRILKKIKADVEAQQTILTEDRLPSSFEIESAVYNVPNSALTVGDLFDAVEGALRWLSTQIITPTGCNALTKANGIDQLLPSWRPPVNGLPSTEPASEIVRLRRFVERTSSVIGKRS